jgi:aspartyl-tRNA(Asn)/glutamyl-tRNA(Gln) amidotransferase subunit A
MPFSERPLWSLSATELAAGYAKGLDPDRVLVETLARIDNVNPRLNAIVTLDAAGARAAAAESTRRWRNGAPLSQLDGVPVTIKDSILVKGMRATWGSKLYEIYVPDADEEPVRRLRDAGAIILGKTNVPELTVQGYTHNILFGVTRNPWNMELTPGGSSGGAVAAVASGMGALALGTDAGGSIRRPCAHTGLVGLKTSRGAVPRGRGFPVILHDFEVIGPIARCTDDVRLAMTLISDETLPPRSDKPLRIGFAPTFSNAPVDPLIRSAVEAMAQRMTNDGHTVEVLQDFDLADPIASVWPVISQTGIAWLLSQHPDAESKVASAIGEIADAGNRYSARDYVNAIATIAAVRPAFENFFARYDILMTPTAAAMPWPAAEIYPTHIDGHSVGPRGHAVFTPFANALGLPALSLPCPVGAHLPIGAQLCAAWGQDMTLLNFAQAYETPYRFPELASA